MTVQELINELEKIEDKDKRVLHWAEDHDGEWDIFVLTHIGVDENQFNHNDVLINFYNHIE